MAFPHDVQDLGFDVDEVRERYAYERERRLRADGPAQFVGAARGLAEFADQDPFANGVDERAAISDDVEVLVIGGGFAGLMAAAKLRGEGIEGVRIVEAASDFGGTWYWNRYPGAQCDIESYIYLPLLEETGYIPKEKYAYQPEIYAHVHRIAGHFGLRDIAIFRTRIVEMLWDEQIHRWRVKTNRGDEFRARFVIGATGPAVGARLPRLPGIDAFAGKMFHTSRWDYAYTGGDTTGGLHKLGDKRVAIIGTGATAIQVVPHVGKSAKHLYVFQRTPSSVDVRNNRPTDAHWARNLRPGWQRERQENFNAIMAGEPVEVDLVEDMWTDLVKYRRNRVATKPGDEEAALEAELADMRKMHEIRCRVDAIVKDRSTAEALKAWYPRHCKRPTFHDDYLPTFNRPNVTLVDTSEAKGVEALTSKGVVVGGVEYEVDCIIWATGYEVARGLERRLLFPITGHGGVTIADHWAKDISTLHGHSTHGFPNWFFMAGGQSGLSANYTSVLDGQSSHIAYIIRETIARGATMVQPTREAVVEWVQTIRTTAAQIVQAYQACTPGYYNNEGQIAEGKGRGLGEIYAPGLNAFNRLLAAWREEGSMQGMTFDVADILQEPAAV